jgi:hypothetical protein
MLSQKSVITKKKASVGKVLKRVPEGKASVPKEKESR